VLEPLGLPVHTLALAVFAHAHLEEHEPDDCDQTEADQDDGHDLSDLGDHDGRKHRAGDYKQPGRAVGGDPVAGAN
jgi:hypothetical protein